MLSTEHFTPGRAGPHRTLLQSCSLSTACGVPGLVPGHNHSWRQTWTYSGKAGAFQSQRGEFTCPRPRSPSATPSGPEPGSADCLSAHRAVPVQPKLKDCPTTRECPTWEHRQAGSASHVEDPSRDKRGSCHKLSSSWDLPCTGAGVGRMAGNSVMSEPTDGLFEGNPSDTRQCCPAGHTWPGGCC